MTQEETDSDNFQEWSCLVYELQDLFENVFCCTSQYSHVYDDEENHIRTSIISTKDGERRSFYQSIQGLFPLILPQEDTSVGLEENLLTPEQACLWRSLSEDGQRSVYEESTHSPNTTVIGDEGLVRDITTKIPNF